MKVFTEAVDLGSALADVADRGAVFVDSALAEPFRHQLAAETATMPLETMPSQEGVAQQEGEMFAIHGDSSPYPFIEHLRAALTARTAALANDITGLGAWHPNHVSVQRYPAGALGITPHLDQKRHRYLVAVFTAEGRAPFTWCRDRSGTPEAVWQAGPGSLVLLRGPGLGGVEDGRPLHMVTGPPVGQRVSVTFRMDGHIAQHQ
jgi:hypothetical protein